MEQNSQTHVKNLVPLCLSYANNINVNNKFLLFLYSYPSEIEHLTKMFILMISEDIKSLIVQNGQTRCQKLSFAPSLYTNTITANTYMG